MAARRGVEGLGPRPKEVPKRKMSQEESRAQRAVVNWWAYSYHQLGVPIECLHSVPNGGFRSVVTASIMKAEGQRRGVFDLKLNVARQGFHGLWLEMKAANGVLSPEQKVFMRVMDEQGYCTAVCRSAREAIDKITHYLTTK